MARVSVASSVSNKGYVGSASPLASLSAANGQGKVEKIAPTAEVHRERVAPLADEYAHRPELPVIREGADAKEMEVRSRIAPYEGSKDSQFLAALGQARAELAEADAEAQGEMGQVGEEVGTGKVDPAECATCASRRYVDGSDDASVSYQTPTHISPEDSAMKVRSHEQEHVVNEQLYAEQDGKEVVSQDVEIYTSICPECGTSYTSGGLTTTVTKNKPEEEHTGVAQNQTPVDDSEVVA